MQETRMVLRGLALAAVGLFSMGGAWASEGHWSYETDAGPAHWGSLKPEFATCKDGMSQSPIDIDSVKPGTLGPLSFDYKPGALEIVNNGHSIQVNNKRGSSFALDGKTYHLLQFHFHSPSEHTIDGKPADMVAHLVHKADDGQLGVVAVLIKQGKANPVIEALWKHMPDKPGEHRPLKDGVIDVSGLLPKDRAYFNYSGSLTTPPCTEGVNWVVLKQPVEVSAEQLSAFRKLYDGNVRPVQALNARHVTLGGN